MPDENRAMADGANTPSPNGRRLTTVAVAIALTALVLAFGYHSLREYGRTHSGRSRGADNLKQIGEFCGLYSMDHQGRMPDKRGDLMLSKDYAPPPTAFLTGWGQPDSSVPKGDSPQAMADWVNQHCEYTYLGGGKLDSQLTARDVVIYDKMEFASRNNGMYIGFGDGHVEWWPLPDALKVIARKPATTLTSQPSTVRASGR